MKQPVSSVIAVLSALALSGCGGSAVIIFRSAHGGTLGLEGDRQQAMADARRLMSESCGGAYTIDAERNVVAGAYHGRTVSEVQLRYHCGAPPEP